MKTLKRYIIVTIISAIFIRLSSVSVFGFFQEPSVLLCLMMGFVGCFIADLMSLVIERDKKG